MPSLRCLSGVAAARLLNARTLAYYTQAVIFILLLTVTAQLVEHSNEKVKALTAIIMLAGLFVVLEVLRRCFPAAHSVVLRLTAPGCACLGNWIALIFFALMVKLPASLARSNGAAVAGWLGAIVIGQPINLYIVAFAAKFADRYIITKCAAGGGVAKSDDDRHTDDERMLMMRSGKLPRAKSRRSFEAQPAALEPHHAPSTRGDLRRRLRKAHSISKFITHLQEGATDDAPMVMSGALLPIEQFSAFGTQANGGAEAADHADRIAARRAALERSLLLEPDDSPLTPGLRRALEALHADQRATWSAGTSPWASTSPADVELRRVEARPSGARPSGARPSNAAAAAEGARADEPSSDEPLAEESPPPLELPTWSEVFTFWSSVAAVVAVVALFVAPSASTTAGGYARDPGLAALRWLFQLSAAVAAHTWATHLLKQHVPRWLAIALQPALISPLLLILIAGGTSPDGFIAGCESFVMRPRMLSSASSQALIMPSLTAWGPGKLITINLVPAITVFAFPTSARMPDVQSTLPLLLPLVFAATLLGMISEAVLARLFVSSDATFALSLIPHSVTVAVAIGFSDILCDQSIASATAAAGNGSAVLASLASRTPDLPVTQATAGAVCATDTIIATSGVLAACFTMITGRWLLDLVGIRAENDAFARGVSMGSVGQAMSVAALKMAGEERANALAAVCMALVALWASLAAIIHGFIFRFLDPLATAGWHTAAGS